MLKNSSVDMDFIGYIEPHEISFGKADVIVADGFTGNVALKSIEGTAKLVRSMVKDEVDLKTVLTPEQYEQYQTEYKIDNDPRLIPYGIGSFIRKTSIDELPQIFYNICMKGNMSVIGPRPVIESELYEKYTEAEQKKLVSVKPGLTGYWQAYARNNAGYESGKRQQMELYYVDNRSVWLDIQILFKSVIAVLTRSGAQ